MADKQQDLATTAGGRNGSISKTANIKTWLDETSREEPWTVYNRSADGPVADQACPLHTLENDMKRDEERVDSIALAML